MLEWRLVKNIEYTIEDFYWTKRSASTQLLQNRVVLFRLFDKIVFPSSKLNAVNLPPDSLWMSDDNLSCFPAKSWTAFVTTSINAKSICFFHAGTDDLSVMSIGNLMCLIAAFAKIRFFWVPLCPTAAIYSISDFSNIPRHSTTARHTLRQNSQNRNVSPDYGLSHVHSVSCPPSQNSQAETVAKRLEEVQTELQEQRATGGLGLKGPSYHATSQHLWFDVFF